MPLSVSYRLRAIDLEEWEMVEEEILAEEEEDEELVALMILGGLFASELRRLRRSVTRTYLTRPQLLPNPRFDTPWQTLYGGRNDRAFITTMGFNVATFEYILDSGFEMAWNTTPIPRDDTNSHGKPRIGARSLDAAGALGLTLHYLASSIPSSSLQLVFAIIPSTVQRYLDFCIPLLLDVVRELPEAKIRWPQSEEEFHTLNAPIVKRHPRLTYAFGAGDGLRLLVTVSDDPEIENASYNGWHHDHTDVSIFVFSALGPIIGAILNAPGSWHDSRVARPLYDILLNHTLPNWYIVCDTAFPRGSRSIAGRIRTSLKANSRLPANRTERAELVAFSRELLSYRQSAEWGMRSLRGSFGRLRVPLDINDPNGRAALIELCVLLHNLRANVVGIDQIRSVYEPAWRGDDDELWFDFEKMLFSDIRRRDRVARFHRISDSL